MGQRRLRRPQPPRRFRTALKLRRGEAVRSESATRQLPSLPARGLASNRNSCKGQGATCTCELHDSMQMGTRGKGLSITCATCSAPMACGSLKKRDAVEGANIEATGANTQLGIHAPETEIGSIGPRPSELSCDMQTSRRQDGQHRYRSDTSCHA